MVAEIDRRNLVDWAMLDVARYAVKISTASQICHVATLLI